MHCVDWRLMVRAMYVAATNRGYIVVAIRDERKLSEGIFERTIDLMTIAMIDQRNHRDDFPTRL